MTDPVTEQGKRALARMDARINRLAEVIIDNLGRGPLSIGALVDAHRLSDQDEVREAVWRLLDAKRIRLNEDRRVELEPQGHGTDD